MAAMNPRLELRPSVALVMTPQLRQAIKLLRLSNLDAARFVDEELERNPLLERSEPGDPTETNSPAADQSAGVSAEDGGATALVHPDDPSALVPTALDTGSADPYREGSGWAGSDGGGSDPSRRSVENVADSPTSLREHLSLQLRLAFDSPVERLIGAHLIAQLDPAGRLPIAPEPLATALGADVDVIERVRRVMLRFDPVGCFARDLKECLAAQLAERDRLDPAMATLLDHLGLVARREMAALMAATNVDADDLADMLTELRGLDPKPGTRFDSSSLPTLIPDILVHPAEDGGFRLELNSGTLPHVLVNHALYRRVSASARGAEQSFLSDRLATANWLVRALAQRADTILKVATEIVRAQEGFLHQGIQHLRPLTLRAVADAVALHESTVSRVTSNKYIATPRGTFELKYFFTPAIGGVDGESYSATAVRSRIKAMIHAEQSENVLSDDAIVHALRTEGVAIARRTVAKYRESLHIPNSPQRRRDKRLPT